MDSGIEGPSSAWDIRLIDDGLVPSSQSSTCDIGSVSDNNWL